MPARPRGVVPELIVDLLEVVEVDEGEDGALMVALGRGELP
jgi:hypothetical protein